MIAKSSGDLGDSVFLLPVLRHYGCRTLYLAAANWTRQRLTWDKWQTLVPLLKAQTYIDSVEEWLGQHVEINGDDFRAKMFKELRNPDSPFKGYSLIDWMLSTHNVPLTAKDEAWITVPESRREAAVVFNRSPRYHNPFFPWPDIVRKYGKDAVFVGLQAEYEAFSRLYGQVPYIQTENLLEVAKIIAGADLFVGNQSCANAISEGLKKQSIVECWPAGMNCLIPRKNVIWGIYSTLVRPIIDTQ